MLSSPTRLKKKVDPDHDDLNKSNELILADQLVQESIGDNSIN